MTCTYLQMADKKLKISYQQIKSKYSETRLGKLSFKKKKKYATPLESIEFADVLYWGNDEYAHLT